MDRKLTTRLIVIAAVLGLSAYLLYPSYKYFGDYRKRTPDQLNQLTDAQRKSYQKTLEKSLKLGLDLQGGMHVVMELDESKGKVENKGDALDRAMEVLNTRVDAFGVAEPTVARQGDNRILVQLPGIDDPERVRKLIGEVAQLKFQKVREAQEVMPLLENLDKKLKEKQPARADTDTSATALGDSLFQFEQKPGESKDPAVENPFTSQFVDYRFGALYVPDDGVRVQRVQQLLKDLKNEIPQGFQFTWSSEQGPPTADGLPTKALYVLNTKKEMEGDRLEDARISPDPDQPGRMSVNFRLDRRGARQFARITEEMVGKQLAIVLDDVVKSAPSIKGKIPSGEGVITGSFTDKEAVDLGIVLRAGAMPVSLKFAEERTVGPTLGSDSLRRGLTASLVGLGLSVLFLLVYYKLSGLLAAAALTMNLIVVLAVMAILRASLSLPGIAGMVLSVAMAVDANVLIFERIREELRKKKTVGASIEAGYKNAFSAILDSNLTTVFAAIVLFYYGTGPVRGFAVTLIIGIAASMFTALFVTRFVYDVITRKRQVAKLSI